MDVKSLKEACAECELLIEFFDEESKKKIPATFIEYLKKHKSQNYVPNFDLTKELEDQKLKEETYGLLAVVYLNYLSETEEQKKELLKFLMKK